MPRSSYLYLRISSFISFSLLLLQLFLVKIFLYVTWCIAYARQMANIQLIRIWWMNGWIIELLPTFLTELLWWAFVHFYNSHGCKWTSSEVESEELAIKGFPLHFTFGRGPFLITFVKFSPTNIFRVFLFIIKNCLRYIEFCFGRTQCVLATFWRPFVLRLPVDVCCDCGFPAHSCMLAEDLSAVADACFRSPHSLILCW